MPKQLNSGALTQALQRAFGFKGRYIPMLDEVIVPVYIIADPSPAEVTRLCAGTVSVDLFTATGTSPYIQIFNPPNSGVIMNIDGVVAQSSIKLELGIAFNDSPPPTQNNTARKFRDRRNAGVPSADLGFNEAQNGAAGDLVAILQVDGGFSQTASWLADSSDPRQPLTVLAPGNGLTVQVRTTIVTPVIEDFLSGNFRWLEIPITEQNPLGGLP